MLLPGLTFLVGISLMALPEVADFARPAADLLQVVGPIAGALGFVAMSEITRGLIRLNLLSGVVLAVGGLLFGLSPLGIAAIWAAAAALAVMAILAPGMDRERYAGGWRGLLG